MGLNLKESRGKRSLEQAKRRTGIPKSTIQAMEKGYRPANPMLVAQLFVSYSIDEATAIERLADWIRIKWMGGRGRIRVARSMARELLRLEGM